MFGRDGIEQFLVLGRRLETQEPPREGLGIFCLAVLIQRSGGDADVLAIARSQASGLFEVRQSLVDPVGVLHLDLRQREAILGIVRNETDGLPQHLHRGVIVLLCDELFRSLVAVGRQLLSGLGVGRRLEDRHRQGSIGELDVILETPALIRQLLHLFQLFGLLLASRGNQSASVLFHVR